MQDIIHELTPGETTLAAGGTTFIYPGQSAVLHDELQQLLHALSLLDACPVGG